MSQAAGAIVLLFSILSVGVAPAGHRALPAPIALVPAPDDMPDEPSFTEALERRDASVERLRQSLNRLDLILQRERQAPVSSSDIVRDLFFREHEQTHRPARSVYGFRP